MADLDSDASSTTSDAMLIVGPASSVKPDPLRYERSYSRRLLLQLSKSDKIRPPAGLKPLSEWYGEYEPPSLHPVNTSSNSGPNGRYAGRDGQTGGRRERERDRGSAAAGDQRDRYSNDRDLNARSSGVATPSATGAMGDFKLAGQRPFTLPKDSDSGDALSAGNRRRQNLRDTDLRDRGIDGKDRDWATADRRRQLGGEFIKKDGRAAEEGGWRSSRETMQLGRDRLPRGDRLERTERSNYNDRDPRGPPASNGSDRRRQPAWMEDEEASASPRHDASNSFQRRGQNGSHMHDASPAWLADERPTTKGRPDKALEELESKQSSGQSTFEASHVDSIQAFKAQMKEMERRKKIQEDKELRREMGLPELPEEHYNKKSDDKEKQGASEKAQSTASQTNPSAAPKSVFADFLLPSSTAKEKEASKASEERPRSSRFARMFAADAAASQVPDRASPATTSSPTPSSAPVGNRNIPQSSSSNSLLAALLPGASTSPAPQTARTTSSPVPPPTQTDNQSMARLMEMLHMSSAPAHVQSPAIKIASRPPGGIAIEGAATTQVKTTSSPQAAAHQAANPAYKEVRVPRNGQEQSLQAPNNLLDSAAAQQYPTAQRKEAIASPQQVPHSRLANRTSGHLASTANGESNLNQGAQRQGQVHSPVPPPQPSVNLLDLLAGHATSSPAASLPPNARDIPRPQQPTYQTHQYQPQQVRGQPMHSPPALGHFSPPASNIPVPMPFGNAGRPSGPPGVPSPANMPYGRPPPGGYMPTPGPHPPQHGPPPTQQHPHPSHMRSPSGHILSQVPQQRALQNGQHQQQYMQSGPANQPLPPPQAFAQQNALAQLLAQGGHPGQQFGGMRSPPNVPPGFQQHQTLPPPQIHMQQNTSPMHGHQNPPPVQQNQIDLMALLTGGGHGSNFASR